MGTYELWLTNDRGDRVALLNPALNSPAFFSYTRSIINMGTLHIGMPHKDFLSLYPYEFTPDLMIDIFRSPGPKFPMRRENVYFLRKPNVYTREDGMEMIEFWGRDPKDLLARRYVIQPAETVHTRKTGTIDDIMKSVVMDQMQYGYATDQDGIVDEYRALPAGEFSVETMFSVGPTLTEYSMSDDNLMDALRTLSKISFQKNAEDSSDLKIYFDVVFGQNLAWGDVYILAEAALFDPILDETTGEPILDESSMTSSVKNMAFQFRTFANLRGSDRTGGQVYSVANGNLRDPSRSVDYLDAKNTAIVRGQGRGDNRITTVVQDSSANLSRWNRVETIVDASGEVDETAMEDIGRGELWGDRAQEIMDVAFVDTPGNEGMPRSLYGADWDMGDLLPVHYGGKSSNVEVHTVYVSVNENGVENVIGRNITDE